MKKVLLQLIFLSYCLCGQAQKRTEDFTIGLPDQKVSGSLYNKIYMLDSRADTSHMGIVQLGAFNKKARVVPKIALSDQLANVLGVLVDSTAKDGELIFQVRQFSFAEVTKSMSEKGYCFLRANLYAMQGDKCRLLQSIDTVVLIKAMDVTQAMFRHGSKTVTGFIAANLLKSPDSGLAYSFTAIHHIDSIEKRGIPLYNNTAYTDGVYPDFNSFARQSGGKPISAELVNNRIYNVKTTGENGKFVKIKPKNTYAVVYQGVPFIVSESGYYLLQKKDDDFYFAGMAKVTEQPDVADAVVAGMMFGLLGSLLMNGHDTDVWFDMKIDHLSGGFIRLREINTNPAP